MPEVKIPTASVDMPAWLAKPLNSPPWPGVVVLHDAAGMSQDLKNHAGWLADNGYLAVAPDLFYPGGKIACIWSMIRDAAMREADRRGECLGLSADELAFYDALETNDSAVKGAR
jgi:carboxymethylenebutenolidase